MQPSAKVQLTLTYFWHVEIDLRKSECKAIQNYSQNTEKKKKKEEEDEF